MEKRFESLLWSSRLLLLFGVICCVITAATLILLGCVEVFHLLQGMFSYLITFSSDVSRDNLVLMVIEILDTFLLSSILFIFSFGLYELFISPIEDSKQHQSKAFQISSIDELKAKLGKVIVMLLVIKLFSYLVEIKPQNIVEILYMAIIVLLVSVSLWLGHAKK
ncbi:MULTISPECIES: YqhA family protein [unclassified Colwellia]|uniref:YqhA family protein n=1 Tax=unclassified Colwellia TaxID=196834 RepID=UPI0015F52228|nr:MULTISPECIES: YqhA family protein [unclassified Colwellia]MBA6356626.1 YqhA family protein [Colwellia sp. BRX8-3]MBA6361186.1 YqhA family protein [Colwellia sp. BRX8-6]MBA6368400.1 YqhA family protein [Colwellia sp. BRX8-5]MBA6377290.1 YqhA family protein [Colwellia sp. BRX8-2]